MRVLVLVLVATATTAHATGLCEDTPRKYGLPRYIHADDLTLVIPATQAWCEETPAGGERRGVVAFLEQRDTAMNDPVILTTARGAAAKRLERMFADVDRIKNVDATLRKRGYRRLVPRTAKCKVRSAYKRSQDTQNGFAAGVLSVHVVAGKRRVASIELGLVAAQRRREIAIAADFTTSGVVVFARKPTCSGPPPGTFGPDDAGDCYATDEIAIHRFEPAAVTACF